jgi:hypothetical protein
MLKHLKAYSYSVWKIPRFTKIGGFIDDLKPEEYFDKKELGNYDLFDQYDMRQRNKR